MGYRGGKLTHMGDGTQVASGGLLRATPHCVRAAADSSLARNTFAVFMQV